jgi:zinc protease
MKVRRTGRAAAAALAMALAAGAAFAQQAAPAKEAPKAPAAAPAAATPATAPAATKAPRYFEKLTYPKLNDIKEPNVLQETLPNGMRLLMVEDHALPQVQFRALVKGGAVAEPKGLNGLTDLFGEVQRTGGVKSMPGDQVDEYLERIGASIETDMDTSFGTVTGKTLTETLDKVLPLYAEFLMAPAFAQEKIDLAKTHLKSMISRRNDDVFGLTFREYTKLIYGKGSPYARQYEYDDIDKVTREDLLNFYATNYRPDETILAVWGDFKAPEMKEKVAKAFENWKAAGPKPRVAPIPVPPSAPSVNFIEKKDVEQAFILLGHLGPKMDDPDYPAIIVLNDILGSGMSSRIFKEVREKRGLAYAAGGALVPAYDHPGAFYVFSSTKPATMSQALTVIQDEIKKIREAPVTDAEMRLAKDGYLNSYAFQFDSTGKIVQRLQTYLFYGYPLDFNKKLRDAVEKVTKDDVLRAAKKDLNPEALTILAVGRQEQWDKPLSIFGKVNVIDIAIPEPKPKEVIPDPTPETLAKGKDLLGKAAKAAGDKALAGLKTVESVGTTTVKTAMGEMEIQGKGLFVLPDRLYNELNTPMGAMIQVVAGEKAWMKMGDRSRDITGAGLDEMQKALWTESGCVRLLKAVLDGKVEAQSLGPKKFEDQDAEVVLVRSAGNLKVFLSPDGSKVMGSSRMAQTKEGPAETIEIYGAFTPVSGLNVPYQTVQKANGEVQSTSKLTSVKINVPVEEGLFTPPPPSK